MAPRPGANSPWWLIRRGESHVARRLGQVGTMFWDDPSHSGPALWLVWVVVDICYPWRIHGAAIYGAPWIPSIYPLYVSIFLPAPWILYMILWVIKKSVTWSVYWPLRFVSMIGFPVRCNEFDHDPERSNCFFNRKRRKRIAQEWSKMAMFTTWR